MDQVKEQIKFYTELLRAALLLKVACASGMASIILKNSYSGYERGLLVSGILLTFVLLIATTLLYNKIKNLIKKL